MGTTAYIMIENENGTYSGNYVNFDGYLEGVGKTLFENWNDEKSVKELCNEKREIRCLGENLNTTEFYPISKQYLKYRMRSINKNRYLVIQNAKQHDYMYFYNNGTWMYFDKRFDEWKPLNEKLFN